MAERNGRGGGLNRGGGRLSLLGALALLVAGCGGPPPPERQGDICAIFEEYPEWYDYAESSADEWGTPTPVLLAFVRHESSFRANVRPPREWFWFIPLGRPSSAVGYAQALDPVWGEYMDERGSWFSSRSDMEDALDFIGWYNHGTWRQLGIARNDAYRLYLAYHEGRGGYRRGTWRDKPQVQEVARRVNRTADLYASQLPGCEARFQCDSWHEIWPLCS